MVSMTQYGANGTTYVGLSTDAKPTEDIGNGSAFIEMDTGKVFFFDAEGGVWKNFGG